MDKSIKIKELQYLENNEIKDMTCKMEQPFAFISYSHDREDETIVRRAFSELYNSGFNLWIDVANLPHNGDDWKKAAMTALKSENCKSLIYFRSRSSLVKKTIRDEISEFINASNRTQDNIITVDLNKPDDPHTEQYKESLKVDQDEKYSICEDICSIISSHCNAIRYYCDFSDDFNRFLNALIEELVDKELFQHFSIQGKIEFVLDGTFHVRLNAEQNRVMKRYRYLLDECLNDPSAKRSLLVIGGPGTGKTVLSMMMLMEYIQKIKKPGDELAKKDELNCLFLMKNTEPRKSYSKILADQKDPAKKQDRKQKTCRYSSLSQLAEKIFKSAQNLEDKYPDENELDLIIADESQRLEDYALYEKHKETKETQPKAIAKTARLSVFFCDPEQVVSFRDFGTIENLKEACRHENPNSRYYVERLRTQMRCRGADSFLEWVDCVLQVKDHDEPETIGKSKEFDLKVFDDPNVMFDAIVKQNKCDGPARVVAGMTWPWTGRSDPKVNNVIIEEYKFEKSWNLDYTENNKSMAYINDPDSIEQIGCIHTIQGLELNYVGVIFGYDIDYDDDNGRIKVITEYDHSGETSNITSLLRGYKTMIKGADAKRKEASEADDKEEYHELMMQAQMLENEWQFKVDSIIKNVYRVLLTRGKKGCYIFCCNPSLQKYVKKQVRLYNDSEIII